MGNTINIFWGEWAFTSSSSDKPIIKTGSIGPTFVVAFTAPSCVAMANIAPYTNLDTIEAIFDRFKANGVSFRDIKVKVYGGWKQDPFSNECGAKIVKKIEDAGFEVINTSGMFRKIQTAANKVFNFNPHVEELPRKAFDHVYLGAYVDATNGTTSLLEQYSIEHEVKQLIRTHNLDEQISRDSSLGIRIESLPLHEVVS